MRAIDMFGGIGGNTTGAKLAGIDVVWTGNHKRVAVDYHERNHPKAIHVCQDMTQYPLHEIPLHDIGLFSPCCQGHTNARGKDKPHHDVSRATAWVVIDSLAIHRPPLFMVENVPEMKDWVLWKQWRECCEALGYALTVIVRDAADHGIPQNRERLYVIGVKAKHPLELKFEDKPHVGADTVIDFEKGSWSKIRKPGRSPATLARIERGRRDLGTDRFLAPFYGSGSGLTGRSLQRPIGTITAKDRWAVVDGDRMRMCTVDEYRRFMSFPDGTILPPRRDEAIDLLGNATCPEKIRDILIAVQKAA